jgi:hypothetical protein
MTVIVILGMFAAVDVVFDVPKNIEATKPGWMDEVNLTDDLENWWSKDIAVRENYVHVVWCDNRVGDYAVFYKRSTDNGLSWDNTIKLYNSTLYPDQGYQESPHIAVHDNYVHIVSNDNNIYYIRSSDNGENWGAVTVWDWTSYPPSPSTNAMIWPDVAANNSYVYIVGLSDGAGHIILKRSSDNGSTWTDWIYVMGYGFPIPGTSIEITSNLLHITADYIYMGSAHWIEHCYSSDNGDTWQSNSMNPIVWVETINQSVTHRTVTTKEDKYCLYYSLMEMDGITHNGTYLKYCYDSDPNTWYGPYKVLTNGEGHFDVDKYHIIWGEKDVNNYRQLHSNRTGQITDYPSNCIVPLIRIYGDIVHILWEDDRHGNIELYYTNTGLWADLLVSGSDIQFDPPSPVEEGTNVFINATIHNYGNSTQDIEVKFYNGNPDANGDLIPDTAAQEIGNATVDIGRYSYTNASINWTPPSTGIYNIYVWADPDNLEPEYNESNNLAFNSLEVIITSPPSPPKGLSARLSSSAPSDVELEWNASPDDGIGEDDVAGYTVYKSTTGVNGTYEFAAWIPATDSPSYSWIDAGSGDEDWDDYFYVVRANDTYDNEEQNNNKVGKVVNYLPEGWNLISIPLTQENTSRESALQTIEGNYSSIFGYHAGKSRPWLNWHRDKPNEFNDVIEINHEEGYYIDMINPDHLVILGKVPSNIQIQLKTGWNLVGYPNLTNVTVDDALSSISGLYTKVCFYNTTTDRDEVLGPNNLMHPGYGYWIHVTEDCVWEVEL